MYLYSVLVNALSINVELNRIMAFYWYDTRRVFKRLILDTY